MTTNTDTTAASGAASQPEALRLAAIVNSDGYISNIERRQIAAELCRMHALTTAAPAAQAADLESLRGKISRIGLDIDRALAGEVVEQSPVEGRLKQIAALARAAAPAAQDAEPVGYWVSFTDEPELELGHWFSEEPCGEGYLSLPLYAHPPRPQADAGAVPAVPGGWRLVPASSDEWMEAAGDEQIRFGKNSGDVYDAMLAAAPHAPAAPVTSNCPRCLGSGEDPEGYHDQSKGDAGHTHDGPCRDCSGTGQAPAAPTAAKDAS